MRSGGEYSAQKATISIKGKDGKTITVDSGVRKMSIKEYQKARGIRSYDIHKEREEERKKKIKTPVKVK